MPPAEHAEAGHLIRKSWLDTSEIGDTFGTLLFVRSCIEKLFGGRSAACDFADLAPLCLGFSSIPQQMLW